MAKDNTTQTIRFNEASDSYFIKKPSDTIPSTRLSDSQVTGLRDHENKTLKSNSKYIHYICKAMDLFKSGMTTSQVRSILQGQDSSLSYNGEPSRKCDYITSLAKKLLSEEYTRDTLDIIWLHTSRYQHQFQEYLNYDYSSTPPERYIAKLTENLLGAIQALEAKEKVLGFHKKGVQIKLRENTLKVKEAEKRPINTFDFSKLQWNELTELLSLLEKMRRTEDEIEGIVELSNSISLLDTLTPPPDSKVSTSLLLIEEETPPPPPLPPAKNSTDILRKLQQEVQRRFKEKLEGNGNT